MEELACALPSMGKGTTDTASRACRNISTRHDPQRTGTSARTQDTRAPPRQRHPPHERPLPARDPVEVDPASNLPPRRVGAVPDDLVLPGVSRAIQERSHKSAIYIVNGQVYDTACWCRKPERRRRVERFRRVLFESEGERARDG